MEDSMAHPGVASGALEMPAWKSLLSVISAVLLAALFLVAGVWKITEPLDAAARLAQAKVPGGLSLAAALALGISETFAGVLLLVPRFRRWGAWISGLLLVAFVAHIGFYYEALRGAECSCFPWVKRAIGPAFFAGDAVMLLLAIAAGWWARRSESLRSAVVVLGAVSVFAVVSWGVTEARLSGVQAPDSITADGQPYSLKQGRILIYFFDPECSHCFQASQRMSKHNWMDTRVVAVATREARFARGFLDSTGMRAVVSTDVEPLKKIFPFGDPPYAVALEHGRQRAALAIFDEREPEATLRRLGFVE